MARLDIVIPVYNEGEQILPVLASFRQSIKTPFRVLICYDDETDTTLTALGRHADPSLDLHLVKNQGIGVHRAVLSGFEASTAPAVLVYPADDQSNAGIIDRMVELFERGCEIVAASRFSPGGCMQGCPWLKAVLVRSSAWALSRLARVPTRDPSNGLRLFSGRVLGTIVIESSVGFTYSLELLVKCHRLGWRVGEVPSQWFERTQGTSRFRVLRWLPAYLRWFGYAFATTYLRRSPETVTIHNASGALSQRAAAGRERAADAAVIHGVLR